MNNDYFDGLAFPWLLLDRSGNVIQEGNGTLFEIDPRAKSKNNLDFFSVQESEGWSVDPMGWAVYIKFLPVGKLVIPGLKVHGISTASGKSEYLQIKIGREYVEMHLAKILAFAESRKEEADGVTRSLIHEIRTANAAIKNAAYELINNDSADDKRRLALTGNIVALSEILSARLDTQDILSAFYSIKGQPKERIQVYKKFDKLVRSYTPTAIQKRIKIEINGKSEDCTLGPDIFEIVPFLLIDNAIKYSPYGGTITCSVETNNNKIICCVESPGIKIEYDEKEKIFLPGYRGMHARLSKLPGDGLGLSVLKTTIELYGGNVSVVPGADSVYEVSGNPYFYNKFICEFPIDKPSAIRFRAAANG